MSEVVFVDYKAFIYEFETYLRLQNVSKYTKVYKHEYINSTDFDMFGNVR